MLAGLYFLGLLIFTTVFVSIGGLSEPIDQMLEFFQGAGTLSREAYSNWTNWEILFGFSILMFILALLIVFMIYVLTRLVPVLATEKFEKLTSGFYLTFIIELVLAVVLEEVLFRWIPLHLVYNLLLGKQSLWIVILVSTSLFAVVHLINQAKGTRLLIFTLPQFALGLILSHTFLLYGFLAVVIIHLLYDSLFFAVYLLSLPYIYTQEKSDIFYR